MTETFEQSVLKLRDTVDSLYNRYYLGIKIMSVKLSL